MRPLRQLFVASLVCCLISPASGQQRSTSLAAERHYKLGVELLQKRKFDSAVAEFRAVVRLRPGFAEGHNALGLALAQKGDMRPAAESFRKATELDPANYNALRNLGAALQQLGDLDSAMAALRKATALKPDDADTHIALGL